MTRDEKVGSATLAVIVVAFTVYVVSVTGSFDDGVSADVGPSPTSCHDEFVEVSRAAVEEGLVLASEITASAEAEYCAGR